MTENTADIDTNQSVSSCFEALMSAMQAYESALRTYASKAMLNRDDANAESLLAVIGSVNRARQEVETAHRTWTGLRPGEPSPKPPKSLAAHSRRPGSTFSVTFGGRAIKGRDAAEVFVHTIEALGIGRVAALGLMLSGIALVGKSNAATYQSCVFTSGFYVCTHASNRDKQRILEKIAGRLGLALSATVDGASM